MQILDTLIFYTHTQHNKNKTSHENIFHSCIHFGSCRDVEVIKHTKRNKHILRGSLHRGWFFASAHRSYFKVEAPQVSFLLFQLTVVVVQEARLGRGTAPRADTNSHSRPRTSSWLCLEAAVSVGEFGGWRLGSDFEWC